MFFKVAQVAAHILGVDLSLINIRPTADHQNANSSTTGGSTTSELCCLVGGQQYLKVDNLTWIDFLEIKCKAVMHYCVERPRN